MEVICSIDLQPPGLLQTFLGFVFILLRLPPGSSLRLSTRQKSRPTRSKETSDLKPLAAPNLFSFFSLRRFSPLPFGATTIYFIPSSLLCPSILLRLDPLPHLGKERDGFGGQRASHLFCEEEEAEAPFPLSSSSSLWYRDFGRENAGARSPPFPSLQRASAGTKDEALVRPPPPPFLVHGLPALGTALFPSLSFPPLSLSFSLSLFLRKSKGGSKKLFRGQACFQSCLGSRRRRRRRQGGKADRRGERKREREREKNERKEEGETERKKGEKR